MERKDITDVIRDYLEPGLKSECKRPDIPESFIARLMAPIPNHFYIQVAADLLSKMVRFKQSRFT